MSGGQGGSLQIWCKLVQMKTTTKIIRISQYVSFLKEGGLDFPFMTKDEIAPNSGVVCAGVLAGRSKFC